MQFIWDLSKAKSNIIKHGVSFSEAETVFDDLNALLLPDPDHSALGDERYLILGFSEKLRLLVVVHHCINEQSLTRIISARKATQKEARFYKRGLNA